MMTDDVGIAFEHPSQAVCSDRSLVLTSLDIPHQMVRDEDRFLLLVPLDLVERARFELWQYDQENIAARSTPKAVQPIYHDPLPGILFYIGTIGLFAWLAGEAAFGRDWLAAGRVSGTAIRDGELWRPFTALTLHLDLAHLLGNMVFGGFFGYLAGRIAGSGVAWFVVVVAAAAGNVLNTLLLDPSHRSIGASTAVFAALGLASGFVWRGRYFAQDRWAYRFGPIVAGVALLAYTGTGSENTDVGAHLAGFACGLAAGTWLVQAAPKLVNGRLQWAAGGGAIGLILGSWMIALL